MPAPLMLEHVSPFSHLQGTGLLWSITVCSALGEISPSMSNRPNKREVNHLLRSLPAFTLFGYDQGVLGGLTTQPSFLSAMGVSLLYSPGNSPNPATEPNSHSAWSNCSHLRRRSVYRCRPGSHFWHDDGTSLGNRDRLRAGDGRCCGASIREWYGPDDRRPYRSCEFFLLERRS
jgi:hypothetical protein